MTRLVDHKRSSNVPNWHGENVVDEQDPSFGSKHCMRTIPWSSTHPRAPNFHAPHFASRSTNTTPHEEQLILLECPTDGHETNVVEKDKSGMGRKESSTTRVIQVGSVCFPPTVRWMLHKGYGHSPRLTCSLAGQFPLAPSSKRRCSFACVGAT